MNPWVIRPHRFEPSPEADFRDICIWCGGRRFNSPHPGNVTTLTLAELSEGAATKGGKA